MKYTQEQIVELAKEVEISDAIEWENLPLDKDKIYQMIGSQVCDMYEKYADTDEGEAILLATITKMLVENFVLNVLINNI
jgi:hypothetical protein